MTDEEYQRIAQVLKPALDALTGRVLDELGEGPAVQALLRRGGAQWVVSPEDMKAAAKRLLHAELRRHQLLLAVLQLQQTKGLPFRERELAEGFGTIQAQVPDATWEEALTARREMLRFMAQEYGRELKKRR